MTSCQTSRAVHRPSDASPVQTARKTAAAHTVPTRDKAHSVGQRAGCCCSCWSQSIHLRSFRHKRHNESLPCHLLQPVTEYACFILVVPQAGIQHQQCLLLCQSARWTTGESGNSKHVPQRH